jgi:gliding motility-associated-like protein
MNFKRLIVFLLLIGGTFSLSAQRGKIIVPASTSVMDPNGDGYVSLTNAGFSNDGFYVDEFEIPMFGIPYYGDGEALNDTQVGPNCGSSDLTVDPNGFSVYAVLDDNQNLIFRFRVASNSGGALAYTILIDTDGKIGPSDPNYSQTNPGFEIDITLFKKNGGTVNVYDIDGAVGCPTSLLSYPNSSHFQRSIADIASCGDQDYFYDIYVPFADLTAQFGITTASKLQFAAVTNISLTCAMAGKISDIGGVNDDDYAGCNYCAFEDLASNQCPVSLDNLCSTCGGFLSGATPTPTMEVPLKEGDSQIRGTADPEAEVFIDIFSFDATPVQSLILDTDANGDWVANLALPLVQGDSVTAVAQVQGKCDSGASGSQISFAVVVLNTAPILNGTATPLPYTENDGAVAVDPGITVSDNEDLDMESATVSISNGFISTEDALAFTNQNGLTGSYNSGSGVLTITGDGTLAQYDQALRSVTYQNSSEDPSETTRTVQFIINDGTENSLPFQRDINVIAVNDRPVIAGTSGATAYLWINPVIINNTMSVSDVDDTQIVSARIAIANNLVANEDFLYFINQNGITGSYDAATGILNLTGAGSFANYAAALNSIEFEYLPSGTPVELTRRIDFTVNDGTDNSLVFSHFVTLSTNNSPPEIVDPMGNPIDDLFVSTDEDTSGNFCLDVIDPEDDPVIIQSEDPANGTVVITGGVCFEYTPDPDFFGDDTFIVTVTDQGVPPLSDQITVTVTVNPVNDNPVLNPLTIDVDEKTTTSICVSASDIEGDTHQFTSGVSNIAGATITDGTSGDLCFDYTPPTNFQGQDQVSVTICDSSDPSVCATGTITVNVLDVNEPPIILVNSLPGNSQSVSVIEDTPKNFCFEVVDPEGDNVTVTSITNISGPGSLIESETEFCFDYTPPLDFNGQSVWEVQVCDDNSPQLCSIITITIDVTPENDAPVINGTQGQTDYPWAAVVVNGGMNITDPDHTDLTGGSVTISSNYIQGDDVLQFTNQNGISGSFDPILGVLTLSGTSSLANYSAAISSIEFLYTPPVGNPNDATRTVEFVVTDGLLSSEVFSQDVIFTITNNPPDIVDEIGNSIDNITVSVSEDENGEFCLNVIDPDGDLLIISAEDPTDGTVTLTGGLCFQYEPDPDFNGEDSFLVTVCDDNNPSLCDEVLVTVIIVPVNDPPVVPGFTIDVNEKTTTEICMTFTDIENDAHEFSTGVSTGDNAVITDIVPGDLCFNYTPNNGFLGQDQVEVTICDANDPTVCTTTIVTINVLDVNEPPVVLIGTTPTTVIDATTEEDTPLELCLDVEDPENHPISINSIINISGGGSLTENATPFCFDFVPAQDFNGISTWEIELCDDQSPQLCSTLTVNINVTPINDAPVLSGIAGALAYPWQTVSLNSYTLVDVDDVNMESATIQFISGFIPNEDILEFIPQNGITGSYDVNTGALSLSGSSSKANYVQALNSVNYFYDYSGYPVDSDRIVEMEISDGELVSSAIQRTITYVIANTPPDIKDDGGNSVSQLSLEMDEDTEVEFCLNVVDIDDDNVVITNISSANDAEVFHSGGVCFMAIPDPDFNGDVTFTVNVCDDNNPSLCDEVTVVLTVLPVNDAPVARRDTLIVMRKEVGTLNLILNDTDLENDALSASTTFVTGPLHGTASLSANGTLTYQSDITYRGLDSLKYEVIDAGTPSLRATGTVLIIIDDNPFTVYQAISPGSDGFNDYWHIEGIDFYPQNMVRLYDRYQNLVFEMKGYDNESKKWTGQSNRGLGKGELPEGTYFYSISLGNEGGTKGGFVFLKRN